MNSNKIKLISISELAKELNLVNKINHEPQTHTIRYWEKNFKQIQKNESKLIQKIHSFDELKKKVFNKFNLIFKSVNDFKFTGLRKNRKNTREYISKQR